MVNQEKVNQLCNDPFFDEFRECNVAMLKEIAKGLEIPYYYKMNKSELCSTLSGQLNKRDLLRETNQVIKECDRQINNLSTYRNLHPSGHKYIQEVSQLKSWLEDRKRELPKSKDSIQKLIELRQTVNVSCKQLTNQIYDLMPLQKQKRPSNYPRKKKSWFSRK